MLKVFSLKLCPCARLNGYREACENSCTCFGTSRHLAHPRCTSIYSLCVAKVFEELEKFGKIEELNVCANLGDHMIGNVYVKYDEEEQAEKALNALNGRFYAGRLIMAEYSPVTDFRECPCTTARQSSGHACGAWKNTEALFQPCHPMS